MEPIQLPVKARHFKGTNYCSNGNCAIAKAAKEFFQTKRACEMFDELKIGRKLFRHRGYWATAFDRDNKKASKLNYDETIIRTIVLTPTA